LKRRRKTLFNKNKGKLRLTDLFSNEIFQLTLEELKWEHAESKNHAWEFIKIKQIEDESLFLAILLRAINNPLKFGDYTYHRRGADMLERSSLKIVKKRKENSFFKITKEFKKVITLNKEQGRGVVIE